MAILALMFEGWSLRLDLIHHRDLMNKHSVAELEFLLKSVRGWNVENFLTWDK